MKYKNIIFDFDETLIETRKCKRILFEYVSNRYLPELDYKTFNRNFLDVIREELAKYEGEQFMTYGFGLDDVFFNKDIGEYLKTDGKELKHRLLKEAVERTGGEYDYDIAEKLIKDLEDNWVQGYTVYEGVYELLNELKRRGGNIYGLTNGFSVLQNKKVEHCRYGHWFDKIYISEDFGVGKPDKSIFEIILKENDLKKEETVMIGDNYEKDIMPAKEMGLPNIHIGKSDGGAESIEELSEILLEEEQ